MLLNEIESTGRIRHARRHEVVVNGCSRAGSRLAYHGVAVGVGVGLGVRHGVHVAVAVAVGVGVNVAVAAGVEVAVGVGVGTSQSTKEAPSKVPPGMLSKKEVT